MAPKAIKKIEDNNTLAFIFDLRADKKRIKHVVKKMAVGSKKTYVTLTPDFDALDVANKIGII
ncbi:hypothetical protein UlMin_041761 [Ulmus minor]